MKEKQFNRINRKIVLFGKTNFRFWLVIGLMLDLLLLFIFSLSSFFRPFYENKNNEMSPNTVTVCKSVTFNDETSLNEVLNTAENIYQNDVKNDFTDISDYMISYKLSIKNESSFFLFVDSRLNLHDFGYLPDDFCQPVSTTRPLVLAYNNYSLNNVLNSVYVKSNGIFPLASACISDFTQTDALAFQPCYYNQSLLIQKIDKTQTYPIDFNFGDIFFTVHLKKDLSDSKLYLLGNQAGYISSLLPRKYDDFIHPAKQFLFPYVVIKSVVSTSLYMSITLTAVIFFAALLTDYLNVKSRIEEIRKLQLFGMKESYFIHHRLKGTFWPLLISDLATGFFYLLFMLIFKAIAGFYFWFNPVYFLVFLAPSLFVMILEIIMDHYLYWSAVKLKMKTQTAD